MGTQIEIRVPDGIAGAYVAKPSGSGPWPAVLFFQDGIGCRPALFEMADRLASHGYYVLLPNMFWRSGDFPPFDPKTVFGGGPELERLIKILVEVTEETAMRDVGAFLDFLAQQPEVKDARRVACTGYCLGGGLSLCTAWSFPDRIAAAASFHGGRLLTAPETPAKVEKVRGRVYIGVAEIDRMHNAEVTNNLRAALEKAKVPHVIELYAGTSHGFAVGDVPVYDREASERHWTRLLEMLSQTFPS